MLEVKKKLNILHVANIGKDGLQSEGEELDLGYRQTRHKHTMINYHE